MEIKYYENLSLGHDGDDPFIFVNDQEVESLEELFTILSLNYKDISFEELTADEAFNMSEQLEKEQLLGTY